MEDILLVVVASFAIIFYGLLAAVLWAAIYPTTRCGKSRKGMPYRYGTCIKNKDHPGPHMTPEGHEFKD